MAPHDFPDGAERCVNCGTLRTSTGQTACPGPQGRPGHDALPPRQKPPLASADYDTIGKRLAELAAERTAAMNEPAKE